MSKLKDEITKEREEALAKACDKIKNAILTFLQENPVISKVRFKLYTPTFNDGDPCELTITEPTFKKAEDEKTPDILPPGDDQDDDEDEYDDDFQEAWDFGSRDPENKLRSAMEELEEVLQAWPEALEHVFGNDQEVTIDRNGKVVTEDYCDG